MRQAHPEIPWQQIIAHRHILAHEYGEIDNELIWSVATTHVPLSAADLPDWVPVDDHTRPDSMRMMQPAFRGYALTNAKRDAVPAGNATSD